MSKTRLAGLIFLSIGIFAYFYAKTEPYSTLGGICGGVGLGMLLFEPILLLRKKK